MIKIRYNKVRINTTENVVIHPIGDTHIGHKNCDFYELVKTLENIPLSENHRILLMGDLLDCGTKGSIGASVYEQYMTPNEQLNTITDIFKNFAECNMIDGCLLGNHEYRIFKDSGIDVLEQFCNQLKIPYLSYTGIVTYAIGNGNHDRAYNINLIHGKAGGGVENALRHCKKMSNVVTADVYLMGHSHYNAHTERIMKYVDSRNNQLTEAKQHFVLTGNMLTYDDSYADQANLEISPKGFPTLILSGSGRKEIIVS